MSPTTKRCDAFECLSNDLEGIIPAIECAHAVAHALQARADDGTKIRSWLVTLSGRGDKDCAAIARYRGEDIQ